MITPALDLPPPVESIMAIDPTPKDKTHCRIASNSKLVRRESIPSLFVSKTDDESDIDSFNPDELRYTCKYDNQGQVILHSLNFSNQRLGGSSSSEDHVLSNPDETRVWWKSSSPAGSEDDHPPKNNKSLLHITGTQSKPVFFAETIEEQVLRSLQRIRLRSSRGPGGCGVEDSFWSGSDVILSSKPPLKEGNQCQPPSF